jgi:hypothetical protein
MGTRAELSDRPDPAGRRTLAVPSVNVDRISDTAADRAEGNGWRLLGFGRRDSVVALAESSVPASRRST